MDVWKGIKTWHCVKIENGERRWVLSGWERKEMAGDRSRVTGEKKRLEKKWLIEVCDCLWHL